MNIAIKATHFEMTEAIKTYAIEKVEGLGKYIDPMEAHIELERDRKHNSGLVFRAEIMLTVGGKQMRADALAEDMYAAIDLVIPKIKEQIAKFKEKRNTLQKRGARSAKNSV
ncbi:MAG: ribosome-associated translation inhibitor RaiA [Candidatus Doudnabacteria bacterium]|nr:ribosome-associated translation inhibitor RaiA [Candidatus Doudnabacteria bacterium]